MGQDRPSWPQAPEAACVQPRQLGGNLLPHEPACPCCSTPCLPALPCRCIKLALVHDVAEAIVGDITPTCGVSDQDKYQLEAAAVQRIKGMLGGASLAGGREGAG